MSAYVDQSDLEAQFGAERVAQVFCSASSDGTTTGAVDAAALAYCIRMASAEADRVLFGIHASQMPFVPPYPDTLKQIVGYFVMHSGFMRRPEYSGDPKTNPYILYWEQARKDLLDIRKNQQAISLALTPSNEGGEVGTDNPEAAQPHYFSPDSTGSGGMGGY